MTPRFCICRPVLSVPRSLVSQNKRRFRQDGFDLDLSYVHPRIIVMGYPAVGFESLFRNSRLDVQIFLNKRHDDNYYVYNFCDEPKRRLIIYDARIDGEVIDHNVPSIQMMVSFCDDAAKWLDANENHVVVLHCKAGKGRAGMMACMLLIRMRFSASATDAIERYNRERVHDRRGLTVVSQKKWVHYYASILGQALTPGKDIQEPALTIKKLKLHNILTAAKPPKLRLRVFTLCPDGLSKILMHQQIGSIEFDVDEEVRGCVLIEFYRERANGCMRAKYFKIWFNTYFLNQDKKSSRVVFARSEMDWTARDKKFRRLPAAFELEMII
ncbi:phosphatidylinositol-trisphosphate 3-phosphatase and dual-specificity protein phosphatase pten [Plasmopara halstedii]|uniref:Phosphatidylinositol-trisphosphate 3-phosphatase and dual-specificity protein phosphatase pten n=1 Tax=Plasmopara halstedii TaxID=4781 RepID=A0A0P1AAZ8_PLAHL|nr:phosphatidylinositol-trisphosphate 3-phosphatase and dual-specificity protein phosphatase pten [Plasmopara halstedii]CEG37447.1 phosphatidylinositol-trisphosphate 3-phosphatase and dual-specificity protein phosphatase pten [Plasmopara halstedii]|eukprot:XP_024573816.1 phosphatidylinositol-trisphosphate 3-phosphatase and dual-specificity protein phosphatase pten [Plasmopara halstedii]